VNKKKKGDKAEREVYKIFESWDYIINPAPRTMRRIFVKGKIIYISQRNDHWGLFDGEARQGKQKIHFQVKSQSCDVSKAKCEIVNFAFQYGCIHEMFHIWLRVPRKGYVRYLLVDSGIWIKDFYDFNGVEKEPFKITTRE